MRFKLVVCMLTFIILCSCAPSKPNNSENNPNNNSVAKTIADKLIGQWEAEEIGDVLTQFEYSTPFILSFYKNQTFTWSVTQNGFTITREGTYKIDDDNKPYKIDLFQTKERVSNKPYRSVKKQWHGIFKFQNSQLKFIVYKKSFIEVRPAVFGETDTQSYRRMP